MNPDIPQNASFPRDTCFTAERRFRHCVFENDLRHNNCHVSNMPQGKHIPKCSCFAAHYNKFGSCAPGSQPTKCFPSINRTWRSVLKSVQSKQACLEILVLCNINSLHAISRKLENPCSALQDQKLSNTQHAGWNAKRCALSRFISSHVERQVCIASLQNTQCRMLTRD